MYKENVKQTSFMQAKTFYGFFSLIVQSHLFNSAQVEWQISSALIIVKVSYLRKNNL